MSEYIIWESDKTETTDYLGVKHGVSHFEKCEEIVRCRVCKHYYEAENYHPNGNYVMRCCKYFDAYNDEVEPYGFCAWGEPRGEGEGE